MPKQIRLNAFQMNSPGHSWAGLWSHPDDRCLGYTGSEFWVDLARIAERGLFDALFLADVSGVYDVYNNSPAAAIETAAQLPSNDPFSLVGFMAAATQNLGFGVTASVGYEQPYYLARRFSTLDHLTRGRIAWNIVTGYLDSGARALGQTQAQNHDERYDRAEEFLELTYKLWEGSWEDEAILRDKAGRRFADPSRVHTIRHKGKWFDLDAIHLSEPSPQRTPFLFQAGTSTRGRRFAARHAEAIFANQSKRQLAESVREIRRLAAAEGRDSQDVKIFVGTTVVVAPTRAEAEEKYAEIRRHLNVKGALALLSGWTGVDFSQYQPDDPVTYVKNNSMQSKLEAMTLRSPDRVWRVRDLADFGEVGGRGPFIVGTPAEVADELQSWIEEADIDGFNINRTVEPAGLSSFVDLVVPELQNRGVYKTAYAEGSLREKIFGPGQARLPDRHPGRAFHYSRRHAAAPVA
ncbi:LLM class flavin-dependent oxidoreductase [Sinirhodobacter populi]|uniref:LLM class flavin-dependent oxidoreductase n=1 Tax=Paenirhodobacter populi TaxID=2306993 RepID=A0A443K4N8_9RHOB|nr:LLM class flavin-dependent oxidoreductase [Sinirhodobacter populi]RWR27702.1 LLM class flavin-dependent oxidoreductase [Sinirhodobacter populi]